MSLRDLFETAFMFYVALGSIFWFGLTIIMAARPFNEEWNPVSLALWILLTPAGIGMIIWRIKDPMS